MQGSVPVPDPTLLTTQQLNQQIAALKELVFTRLEGMEKAITVFNDNLTRVPTDVDKQVGALHELIYQRFQLSDEKFRALHESIETAKTALDDKIEVLITVRDEQMRAVRQQFGERDSRLEQTVRDLKDRHEQTASNAKDAVAAALHSAALANAKSEAATEKAIDGLRLLLQTTTNAISEQQRSGTVSLDGKLQSETSSLSREISDMKDRVTIIESRSVGATQQREVAQGSQIQWVGIMGLVLGAVVGLGGILMALSSDNDVAPLPERVVIEQAPPGNPGSLR